jgi:hypothetical protein
MDEHVSRNLRPSLNASARRFTDIDSFPEPARTRVGQVFTEAKASLAREFVGVTAGDIPAGLFPVVRTGISMAPVLKAADRLRAALGDDRWKQACFPVEDDGPWRSWHNMHIFLMRHGVSLADLDDAQRTAALALVEACSSAAGYRNARDIMRLNEHAAEITGDPEEFGEWWYWISIFGEPSETAPWGWQIDGHHLIVNCFIYGDQMVMTPDFRGSEPVHAKSGKYEGTRVFHEEQSRGLQFMQALSGGQQEQAVIGTQLPRDVITTAQMDNLELAYAGIRSDALEPAQQKLLMELVEIYVGRIRTGHAEVRMDEVKKHLADTHFGWIGKHGGTEPFYYRVHSPVILIEFDHLPGIIWDNMEPTHDHIHTIVRTPNGNDYGRNLLRQHYERHDHSHAHTPHRKGLV